MIHKNEEISGHIVKYANDTAYLYAFFFIGFLVPFMMGHPQELVGVIVNATLVLSAIEFGFNKKTVPLLFAPSLGVLARGLIFGPLTPFLLIMLPFIWISNAIIVFGISKIFKEKDTNYGIALGISALAKSGFLFGTASILVSAAVLPAMFLTAMGIIQLYKALVGGAVAFGIHKAGVVNRLKLHYI